MPVFNRPGFGEGIIVPPPPPPPPGSMFVVPPPTGRDDTELILTAIAATPDLETLDFPISRTYVVDDVMEVVSRSGLIINANGCQFNPSTLGNRTRSQWRFRLCENTTLNDPIVHGANPAAGEGESAYNALYEAQHPYEFLGCTNMILNRPKAYDIWGDFVYVGSSGSFWCDGIYVNDVDFARNGRQGFSVTAGRNVILDGGNFAAVRRSFLDLEPNVTSGGCEFVTVRNLSVAGTRLNFVSSHGAAAPVHDILVDNVHCTGSTKLRWDVLPPGVTRRSNFAMTNCSAVLPYGTGSGAGSVSVFKHVDGITFTGNVQPVQAGRSMAMVNVTDCTDIDVSGNTVLPDGIQLRVV